MDLEGAVELAKRHAIAGIELRALAGSTDLPEYFSSRESAEPTHLEFSVRCGVKLLALNSSFPLVGGDAVGWDELMTFTARAEKLGVPWVRVFDGGDAVGETELCAAWKRIRQWQERRARFGWKTNLLVETHGALKGASSIRRFLAGAPGVGLLWDSHYTWLNGEDPVTTWRAIGRHVAHIHVKDSVADRGAAHGHRYVLPGMGDFPMARLQPWLAREFSGAVSLEWERLWHPELPALEAALESARTRHWW